MSKTIRGFEKLNKSQQDYLIMESTVIKRAMKNGLIEENERHRGKLRGFLECLCQMGIISGSELQALYLYFVTTK